MFYPLIQFSSFLFFLNKKTVIKSSDRGNICFYGRNGIFKNYFCLEIIFVFKLF